VAEYACTLPTDIPLTVIAMNQKPPSGPAEPPPKPALPDRKDRLAAALRENLKRRKAQGRARAASAVEPAKS